MRNVSQIKRIFQRKTIVVDLENYKLIQKNLKMT